MGRATSSPQGPLHGSEQGLCLGRGGHPRPRPASAGILARLCLLLPPFSDPFPFPKDKSIRSTNCTSCSPGLGEGQRSAAHSEVGWCGPRVPRRECGVGRRPGERLQVGVQGQGPGGASGNVPATVRLCVPLRPQDFPPTHRLCSHLHLSTCLLDTLSAQPPRPVPQSAFPGRIMLLFIVTCPSSSFTDITPLDAFAVRNSVTPHLAPFLNEFL